MDGLHYEFVFIKGRQLRLKLTGKGVVPGDKQPWCSYRNLFSEIWIEEGITVIGERAFIGYRNLMRVWLPASLRTVGKDAFADSPKIEEIYYFGWANQLCEVDIHADALPKWAAELIGR